MQWKVCLSDIDYGPEELDAVAAVLRSKWLSMGDVTREFESRLADRLGVRHAILVSSGTAALHLANLAVGVGPGDEVIVPSLTFVASVNASVYCGASTVFADIVGPDDLNVSPEDVRKRITPRTRVIVVVHYGGYPVDMCAIGQIAREHNLAVIEDAAHAPGASLDGRMLGTIGDVGCFSFFSNKNLVTGEGGAVVTNRDDLAEEIRLRRSHGMTSVSYDRHKGHAFSYDVTRLGYNYRATEICAALATIQLDKLPKNNARRAELTAVYREHLHGVDGVIVPFQDYRGVSSHHILPVLLPPEANRHKVMTHMRDQGIQTSIHYPPVHRFSAYCERASGTAADLPATLEAAHREVTLPLHPLMRDEDAIEVASALLRSVSVATRTTWEHPI